MINLCDDCRRELCEKIHMEEPTHDTVSTTHRLGTDVS